MSPATLSALLAVGKQSPVILLVVLVWFELHEARVDLGKIRESIAVIQVACR